MGQRRLAVLVVCGLASVVAGAATVFSSPKAGVSEQPSPRATAASTSGLARPAVVATTAAPPRETGFDHCIESLMRGPESHVRANVGRTFRLPNDDAFDVVRDALVSVCLRHADRPYDNLVGALTRAAENRARDAWRRRRYGSCRAEAAVPNCTTGPGDDLRFEQEQRAADAALCQESQVAARIIHLRAAQGLDFGTIGPLVGLSADEARTQYHNAIRRVQKRVMAACGN